MVGLDKELHKLTWGKGIGGLFKRACWEIPEVMGASFMALIGIVTATYGVYRYVKLDGDNREYHFVYYLLRHSDEKVCKLKNPVFTQYPPPPPPEKCGKYK